MTTPDDAAPRPQRKTPPNGNAHAPEVEPGYGGGFGDSGRSAVADGGELQKLLVDSVRDYAIFALDAHGCILTWNAGAERLKGYRPDEIIGQHFSVFYPPADRAADKPGRALREATREGRYEDEGWRVRKDGTRFWASVVITALRDDSGALVGFAKVTRDLTERRVAQERAVADARRLAETEATSRAKSEFLTAMSHELRTPLNATLGYLELIEMGLVGQVTEQQRDYLQRIRGNQEQLLWIVSDLLNYSRIQAGHVSYDLVPVPVHAIVAAALPSVESQAATKGLTVDHGPCPAGLMARADRTKVEQIVFNLLTNAVKFTPTGGRIAVSCGGGEGTVAIIVGDTGPGIPADKQGAIFEPFVQLGRSLSSSHEGTGLGLAISRDLARAMGGDVTVESTPGSGAKFTLTLPKA